MTCFAIIYLPGLLDWAVNTSTTIANGVKFIRFETFSALGFTAIVHRTLRFERDHARLTGWH